MSLELRAKLTMFQECKNPSVLCFQNMSEKKYKTKLEENRLCLKDGKEVPVNSKCSLAEEDGHNFSVSVIDCSGLITFMECCICNTELTTGSTIPLEANL